MKRNRKFSLLYVVLAITVSVGAAFFQHILENNYLDRNGLYEAGIITPEIFVIYAVFSALLIFTVVFWLRFDIVPKEMKRGNVNTAIISVLAAIALVYAAITFFMGNNNTYFAPGTSELMVQRLKTAASIVAFPAALYFMITAFMGKAKSKLTPYLSFFPLLWTLFFVMSMYFDRTTLINSPVKSLQQFALVVLMLYQLCEIRAHIGKVKMVTNFVLSLMSTLFLSAAFVPAVVDIILGTKSLTLDNMYCAVGAVMALYTLSRAIDFAFYSEIDITRLVMERAKEEREKAEKLQEKALAGGEKATVENTEEQNDGEISALLDSLEAVADSAEEEGNETEQEDDAGEVTAEQILSEDTAEEVADDSEDADEEEDEAVKKLKAEFLVEGGEDETNKDGSMIITIEDEEQ